jgi:hypothetical protein
MHLKVFKEGSKIKQWGAHVPHQPTKKKELKLEIPHPL